MNESAALDFVAVRALETADRDRALWSDADRAWATRAAAEITGADARPDVFFARRAALAAERVGERHKTFPRTIHALRWRPWVGYAIVGAAFVLGAMVDRVGDAQRINVLAPPVLGLLAWNLALYAAIFFGFVQRYGDAGAAGPLRRAVIRLAAGARGALARTAAPLTDAVVRVAADWARIAAPLYAARAARILHLAAAALALGVVGGMYVRGIAFEYRATWESTFLDAATVRALLAVALAPGALISGIGIPGTAAIEAIRAPGSANAAPWLHLLAATLALVVVLPRLLLAAYANALERLRAARLPLMLDDAYAQRLLRALRGGPARVRVLPYSFTPSAAATAGLEAVLVRALAGSASVSVAPPTGYGGEDALPDDALAAADGPVVALFNLVATPEREAHVAFVNAVAARAAHRHSVLVVVDESAWRARWGDADRRIEERRAAWRDTLGGTPIFTHLAAPDLAATAADVDAALARPAA